MPDTSRRPVEHCDNQRRASDRLAVGGLNTTREGQASPSIAGDDRPVRSRAIAWSVVAVIVVESLYALWTASRGFFWQDDFIDLQALHQLGFGGRLLEQPVFGHFIPGFTVVDYLLSLIVPYQWWVVVLIDVALFALSLILLDRLLATLFGSSWLSIALIAIAGASFSLVPSLVWWATALEYLVAIPATLLACLFHVRYLRSGQIRYAVFGAVALAVGFAFFDGLFVSVLFIVLMTVLFWPAGPGLHGIVQTLEAYARAWVCYGVPVALELGWRFAHHGLYATGGSATAGQTLGFVGLSWTQTLIPLTLGVDVWVLSAHAERAVAGLIGQLLFIGFVVGTILRRRSAWRAWVLLGSTFFASAALVGATRAGTYGPGDASDVKYVALDVFFLVISVGFALLPVRPPTVGAPVGSVHVENPNSRSRSFPRASRPAWFPVFVVFTVLAVVFVYGMVLVFDQDRDGESVGSHASRVFFSNFATSWAASTSATSHAFLWDTEINPRIVTRAFFPYDSTSVTVGRLHPEIKFDQWGGTGYLLRSDGSVVRATTVTKARGIFGEGSACAGSQHEAGRIVVTLDHRLNGANRWFGLISYQSATRVVATQPDGTTLVLPKGRGTVLTAFPSGHLDSASWSLPAGANVCITGLKVVVPEPAGTP